MCWYMYMLKFRYIYAWDSSTSFRVSDRTMALGPTGRLLSVDIFDIFLKAMACNTSKHTSLTIRVAY